MQLTLVSQNPFRAPEFKKLFEEWNQKLKDSGFEDAEDFTLPEPALKCWHSFKLGKEDAQTREASVSRYYDLATDLLHNGFSFKTDLSRRVWELHCQGKSVRQIEQALYSQMIGYKGRKRSNVADIICIIQKESGIKNG